MITDSACSPGCSGFLREPGLSSQALVPPQLRKGFPALLGYHLCRGKALGPVASLTFLFALSSQWLFQVLVCLSPSCPVSLLCPGQADGKMGMLLGSIAKLLVPFFSSTVLPPPPTFPQNGPPGTSCHQALLKDPTSDRGQGMAICRPCEC